MAMFFNDSYIACPKCGNKVLYSRQAGNYEPDTKDNTVLKFLPVYTELVCSQCGTVARRLGPLEKIER